MTQLRNLTISNPVDANDNVKVSAQDSAGAYLDLATETKQDAILTELQGKADLDETQPVSAASLPLPAGASTSAKQLADNHQVTVSTITDTSLLVATPFEVNVSKGLISGHSFVSKFGQNESIGTGAFEDIWDGGGTYTYPADSTAPITHIYSTAAGDTQQYEVQGLDINGDLVVQNVTATGTTVSILTTALWRVFRIKNIGTTDNAGVIHASDAGKAVSYAQIGIGNNQTLMALYTIPNGKTGYLCCGGASMVGLTRAYSIDGHFYMRSFGGVFQLKNTFGLSSDGSSSFEHTYKYPLPIAGKTDIRVRAVSSAANGVLNATFDILLVDN